MRNVVYICDDKYAMPTRVSIVSLRENATNEYTVHIITIGLNTRNRGLFLSLSTENFHIIIHDIEPGVYEKKTIDITQRSHVTPTALLKFELPNILKTVDTVLYLDSDIIINHDISELFELRDFDCCYAACVRELWKLTDGKTHDFYFNSGVMLFNLKKLRNEDITCKLWEKKVELLKDPHYTTMDQDTLNIVLAKRTKELPIIYNFNPYFGEEKAFKSVSMYFPETINSIEEISENVKIIHYVGKEDKPWVYSTARMVDIWEKYYKIIEKNEEKLTRIQLRKGFYYRFQQARAYLHNNDMRALIKLISKRIISCK